MVAAASITNDEPTYHAVSRSASDQVRPERISSCTVVEDIADPAHGVNQLGLVWIVKLCAQSPYMDINDVRVAFEIHVPDLLGDDISRQHFARPPCKKRQEGEFLARQIEFFSCPDGALFEQIQL